MTVWTKPRPSDVGSEMPFTTAERQAATDGAVAEVNKQARGADASGAGSMPFLFIIHEFLLLPLFTEEQTKV